MVLLRLAFKLQSQQPPVRDEPDTLICKRFGQRLGDLLRGNVA